MAEFSPLTGYAHAEIRSIGLNLCGALEWTFDTLRADARRFGTIPPTIRVEISAPGHGDEMEDVIVGDTPLTVFFTGEDVNMPVLRGEIPIAG